MKSLINNISMTSLTILELIAVISYLVSSSSSSSSASLYDFSVAKPNCIDHCGDVKIPFPFGLNSSEDCYHSRNFFTTCNNTYDPPKLFLEDTNIEITDISLDGQLTLLQFISKDCYINEIRVSYNDPSIWLVGSILVNYTANKFTLVGCDTFGYAYGDMLGSRTYSTGCMTTCSAKGDLIEGSCTGLGCCQTSIPKDVWRVNLSLGSYDNYGRVWDYNDCGYAFVVKEGAFNFSVDNFTSLRSVEKLPMVADWSLGINVTTCQEAKANASSYACKSEYSECYKPGNGYGYRCSCLNGFEGNPYLTDGCKDINECERNLHNCEYNDYCKNNPGSFTCKCPKGDHGDGIKGGRGCYRGESVVFKIVAGILLGIVVLMLAASWLYLELKRRRLVRMRKQFFLQNGGTLLQEKLGRRGTSSSDGARIFSEAELQKSTNHFHSSMIIGQGGFGTVYKGLLQDNRAVAIKKSKQVDPDQVDPKQVEQFANEVVILSQINHRNVVKFLGCCVETPVPLLVYEFVTNGTLFEHIHDRARSRFLTWDLRLRIAAEAAGVLSYLHSSASPPIIHRDVKSANILLDRTFTAKVSDFGASRLVPFYQTQITTMVQGTLGYLDPEYMQTSQLTEKSDVYSFGVVLVELLTGMKALSYERPENEQNLANFFLSKMKQDRLFHILDDSIATNGNKRQQIKAVASLAKSCLCVRGEDRPDMKQVSMELEGLITRQGKHSWDQSVEEASRSLLLGFSGFTGVIEDVGSSIGSSSAAFESVRNSGMMMLGEHGGR